MSSAPARRVPIGETAFVQACARLMSAAWIRRQIREDLTPSSSGLMISGIAYAMRYTMASDIGMAFELAMKTLQQGLSCNKDGQPQVLKSHDLVGNLWEDIRQTEPSIESEINQTIETTLCERYGPVKAKDVLSLSSYLKKHEAFLDIENRYANPTHESWESFHRFAPGLITMPTLCTDTENNKVRNYVDGIAVLLTYWEVIMRRAWELRWPDSNCKSNKRLTEDRDNAKNMMDKAIKQGLGIFD